RQEAHRVPALHRRGALDRGGRRPDRKQQGGHQVAHLVRAPRADVDGQVAPRPAPPARRRGGGAVSLSCARAARLSLASIGAHASAAERLELEAHLAGCARCSAEHAALSAVRAGLDVTPAGLGAAARERVLRAARSAPPRAQDARRRLLWPLGAGAALAAAAAVALWLGAGGARRHDAATAEAAGEGVSAIEGDVTVAGAPAAAHLAGGALTLRSEGGGRARLDDAAAELARATEIGWQRA